MSIPKTIHIGGKWGEGDSEEQHGISGEVIEINPKRQLIVKLTTINEEEAIDFLARNYTIPERAELIKYAMSEFPDNEIAQGVDFTMIWKLSERCRKAVPVRNELRRSGEIDEPFAVVVRDEVALVFSDPPYHREQR